MVKKYLNDIDNLHVVKIYRKSKLSTRCSRLRLKESLCLTFERKSKIKEQNKIPAHVNTVRFDDLRSIRDMKN